MAKVTRVEAKIILQKNDDGHWLVVESPSGKHAMVNIENVFKGSVREGEVNLIFGAQEPIFWPVV